MSFCGCSVATNRIELIRNPNYQNDVERCWSVIEELRHNRFLENMIYDLNKNCFNNNNKKITIPTRASITVSNEAKGNLAAELNSNICSKSTEKYKNLYNC